MSHVNLAINTQTSGKFRNERLNGRDHMVTSMIAIVGDSVMNSGLYPDEEVDASFEQLNQLPAPNGHPQINGNNVSAFHPLAVNAHNIGAFIANPTKQGKYVINELWIDKEIANQSDDGIELMDRIKTSRQVGVSTGLQAEKMVGNGEIDGKAYDWKGINFKFDHVAILLNEKPAGDETYLLNDDGSLEHDKDTFIVNQEIVNEFAVSSTKDQLYELLQAKFPEQFVYIEDCIVEDGDGGKVIYEVESELRSRSFSVDSDGLVSIEDVSVPVRKKVEFIELADGDVTNNSNQPEIEMTEEVKPDTPADDIVTNEITVESAIEFLEGKGMVVNSQAEDKDAKFFNENKAQIQTLLANEKARLDTLRTEIVANSGMTDEDVADMDEPMLRRLAGSFQTNDYGLQGGSDLINQGTGDEFEDSYAPNYDAEVH